MCLIDKAIRSSPHENITLDISDIDLFATNFETSYNAYAEFNYI
jgi:hypothetical protein